MRDERQSNDNSKSKEKNTYPLWIKTKHANEDLAFAQNSQPTISPRLYLLWLVDRLPALHMATTEKLQLRAIVCLAPNR